VKTSLNVVNTNGLRLRLIVEPWGREYDVGPGAGQRLDLDGPDAGLIELRTGSGELTVYGWVASTINDGIDHEGPRVPRTPGSDPTG
jgi:hypothetical protein